MFGVDQCRQCGMPIPVKSPKAREEQEKAIRKPLVAERMWRARGFLTPPTYNQWYVNPADGCCFECARIQLRRKMRPGLRLAFLAAIAAGSLGLIIVVLIYMRH